MCLIKCPYCGRVHMAKSYLNIICPCGAKYYIHTGEWLDRKGPNHWKKEEK